MDKRKTITLFFDFNENWIGGTYYILNIIKSLNVLSDIEKPYINVLYNDEKYIKLIKEINYPFINFLFFEIKTQLFKKIINKISRFFFNTYFFKTKIKHQGIINLYPMQYNISIKNVNGFYFWIPDFQEMYLPELFDKLILKIRKLNHLYLVNNNFPIIFSSYDALNDFNKFYPNNTNKKEVLKFVSIINENYLKLNINDLKLKFNINKKYFIVSNQFWVHKNHKIIIEAAKVLKVKNEDFLFVLTGKEYDKRNPEYLNDLKKEIINCDLIDRFRFLGFIERDEQLQLMNNSIAIVQPSLFEGWSTVVEDAKALNHAIILSDIPIHREQISDNCLFFDPKNSQDLVEKLIISKNNNIITKVFDLKNEQLEFAKKIISIL